MFECLDYVMYSFLVKFVNFSVKKFAINGALLVALQNWVFRIFRNNALNNKALVFFIIRKNPYSSSETSDELHMNFWKLQRYIICKLDFIKTFSNYSQIELFGKSFDILRVIHILFYYLHISIYISQNV